MVLGKVIQSYLISDEHPVFYFLVQSRKRVYADQAVQVRVVVPASVVSHVLLKVFLSKWTSRLIIIVWQSAIPPTLCAVGNFLVYIASQHLSPVCLFIVLLSPWRAG